MTDNTLASLFDCNASSLRALCLFTCLHNSLVEMRDCHRRRQRCRCDRGRTSSENQQATVAATTMATGATCQPKIHCGSQRATQCLCSPSQAYRAYRAPSSVWLARVLRRLQALISLSRVHPFGLPFTRATGESRHSQASARPRRARSAFKTARLLQSTHSMTRSLTRLLALALCVHSAIRSLQFVGQTSRCDPCPKCPTLAANATLLPSRYIHVRPR